MAPSYRQLDLLFGALKSADLDSLRYRLAAELERDRRSGSAKPDGYGSSTEGAAIARLDGTYPRDRQHQHTIKAVRALEDAVVALNELRRLLDGAAA